MRRWRLKVESLIDEGSPELQKWNVSPERIDRLKAVIADPHRENEAGETVVVRQKPQEATAEERAEFWWNIRNSATFRPTLRRQPIPR